MKFVCGKDYAEMSAKAAEIIAEQVKTKPNCVLGLATGSSPVGTYKKLIEWYEKGELDFSAVSSVNLDEYRGLSGDNDQSYRYFMNTNLFDHINIDKAQMGVGCVNSWGRLPREEYIIQYEDKEFRFVLRPLK